MEYPPREKQHHLDKEKNSHTRGRLGVAPAPIPIDDVSQERLARYENRRSQLLVHEPL
jgi:hypothetical protein